MISLRCFQVHIFLRVVLAAFIVSLVGLVFGFSSIKPILLREKMYYNLCENGTTNGTSYEHNQTKSCPEQVVRMNSILFVLAGGLNAGTLFTGFLLDKLSPRTNLFIGGVVWSVSLFGFGCSTYFRALDPYFWWIAHLTFLLCGVSATLVFFVFMKYPRDIPKIAELKGVHEVITSLLTVCWDLSIMWVIYFIADYTHIPLIYLFIGLIILMSGPLILSWIFLPLPEFKMERIGHSIQENEEEQDENQYLLTKDIENESLFRQIFKFDIILMYFFMINLMQHQSWFLTTIYDQVLDLSKSRDVAETHNTIFSILLPVIALLFNFIFAKLLQNFLNAIGALTLFTFIYTIIRYMGNVNLFYLMYCVWIPWRISSFTLYYAYFEKTTAKSKYSFFIMSIGFTIGGLLSFITVFYNYLVEFYFNGSFFYINVFLDIFNIFIHLAVVGYLIKKQNPNLRF